MIIKLNNKFYTKDAITQALDDFEDFLSGRILNSNYEIELMSKQSSPDNISEEFLNYVLGLMKQM